MEENVSDFSAPKVKPLVWEMYDAWTVWSKTAIGTYRITTNRYEDNLYDVEFPNGNGRQVYGRDAAIKCAQDGHKYIVLSMLEGE